MASYSPTVYAYPEGVAIGSSLTGGTRILGASGSDKGEGVYYRNSPPPIRNVNTGANYDPVYVAGFEELYVMPVATAGGDAGTMYVWAYYGNKAVDADQTSWTVMLLYSSAITAVGGGGGLALPSPSGTAYTSVVTGAPTGSFSAVLDNTIGAAIGNRAGSADVIGVIGIPHLGGADYVGITFSGVAAPTGSGVVNAMIRMG